MSSDALERYAKHSDPDAFRQMVQEFQGMVYGTCRRILGDAPELDDAVQETFIKFARKAGEIRSANPAAWLHVCARSTALNLLRGKRPGMKQRPIYSDSDLSAPPVEPSDRADDAAAVDACIDELPEVDRDVVVSYFFVKESQVRIAERLGVSQAAVNQRLERVLAVLRGKLLGRRVVVPALLGAFLADLAGESDIPVELTQRLAQLSPYSGAATSQSAALLASKAKTMAGFVVCFALSVAGAFAWHAWRPQPSNLIGNWDFSSMQARPEDEFDILQSAWSRRDAEGVSPTTMHNDGDKPLIALLPRRFSPRPFMLKIWVIYRPPPLLDQSNFDVTWWGADNQRVPFRRQWINSQELAHLRALLETRLYFFDRYLVVAMGDSVRAVVEYERAFPSDRLALLSDGLDVHRIEATYFDQSELPADIRDPMALVKRGGFVASEPPR